MKQKIIRYVISVVVCLGIILGILGGNGVFTEDLSKTEIFRFLCDAFFVAAIVELGLGGLIWSADQGTFDGLGYSVSLFFNTHYSTKNKDWHKKETYQEYQERKHAPEKKKQFLYLLIVGGVMLLLAVLFLLLYHYV